jgi:hypothetical protein
VPKVLTGAAEAGVETALLKEGRVEGEAGPVDDDEAAEDCETEGEAELAAAIATVCCIAVAGSATVASSLPTERGGVPERKSWISAESCLPRW